MRGSAWAAGVGAVALLLITVGFGGAGDAAQDAATPIASPMASPTADGTAFTVDMIDIAFAPMHLAIPANVDVTITLPNKGAAIHNFVIEALGVKSPYALGGQTVAVAINAPAGNYEYVCTQRGHQAAGMVGTLTVR